LASQTDLYNRALSKLGAGRIVSPTDQSVNARACNACYDILRQAELSKNPWNFAIVRQALSANAVQPPFGIYVAYQLPTGWLRLLPPDIDQNFNDRDWIIEGQNLLTAQVAPVNVRCIVDIQVVSQFHTLFVESLSSLMAFEMCEQLTQSNTKKQDCRNDYRFATNEARKVNAIQKVPEVPTEDSWITARSVGGWPGGWGPGWGSGG
jgi:hypothetical protein